MKIAAAAIQMPASLGDVVGNVDRADELLRRAHDDGVELAVLPEMFNTGYGLIPDYTAMAEGRGGPVHGQGRTSHGCRRRVDALSGSPLSPREWSSSLSASQVSSSSGTQSMAAYLDVNW